MEQYMKYSIKASDSRSMYRKVYEYKRIRYEYMNK